MAGRLAVAGGLAVEAGVPFVATGTPTGGSATSAAADAAPRANDRSVPAISRCSHSRFNRASGIHCAATIV
jgi:hypothetical protein